ncbi:helix-turn-helix transcriptional regulator [Chryseobacterium sp. Tr-659]|uniref:winged helix-turn-helix transcriptional regulator n=1 Tax=Chryseobacterium sp. Tr-659 TaxID=2608340 RepID=UPI00141DAA23|nr:helix-turn-helix domain-containing protein [Chryseobacterium sp. Tr-659]NIF06159.1 helix-turn-helix transcriptional regulator [Chryseobacterium sp. Tr-659]
MIKKPKTDPVSCTAGIRSMQDALDMLGNKWSLLIVHYLMTRTGIDNTFKKMEKDIEGISARMLSKELKALEFNKMVRREVMDTKPITVNYSITDYGKEANNVIQALVQWGMRHREVMFEQDKK